MSTTLLTAVRARLHETFGHPMSSASVTFLGAEPLEVIRFGPDPGGLVRYATVGISLRPMHSATAAVVDPVRGPRVELVLSLRPGRDGVLAALAVLGATPVIDSLVLAAGVTLDLQAPLWPGAGVSAALIGESGGLVRDLDLVAAGLLPALDGVQPVRFHPVLPMTAGEAALCRAKGAAALQQLWLDAGTDLRDSNRPSAV